MADPLIEELIVAHEHLLAVPGLLFVQADVEVADVPVPADKKGT